MPDGAAQTVASAILADVEPGILPGGQASPPDPAFAAPQRRVCSGPAQVFEHSTLKVGDQRFTLQAGARYWADSPDAGAHGWGARFAVTFLFPK